jgi:hypothetical protein
MALVKPEIEATTVQYTGILEVALWDFKDRSNEFDWADIFLSVELKPKKSEYHQFLEIAGRIDKDNNGDITGGFILKRLYRFFQLIGFTGGLNTKGEWEDADGNKITSIGSHLNERFQTGNPIMEPSYDYVAYSYKELPRKAGQKAYTKVHHRLEKNDAKGIATLEDHVQWMKRKNFIKEWVPELASNGVKHAVATENL